MENQPQKSPLARGTRGPGEKQQLIERWQQSGLNRYAFCKQNNLSYYSLMYWTRKKRVKNKAGSAIPGFIPVHLKSTGEQIFAQIETGSGKRVQIYQPVSANFLRQLLR